jgi:hypothetical protein
MAFIIHEKERAIELHRKFNEFKQNLCDIVISLALA